MNTEIPYVPLGILFILVGIAFILIPILAKQIPQVNLDKIPWILLYVYRTDNFVFATSPLLIIISVAVLIWTYLHR